MTGNRLGVSAEIPGELLAYGVAQHPHDRWATLGVHHESLIALEWWGRALEVDDVSPKDQMIARLAVTRRSKYEFRWLAQGAASVGLSTEQIEAIADEDWTSALLSENERALLRSALMFDAGHGIGDGVVEQLGTHYNVTQMMVLCHECAYGGALARLAIALQIETAQDVVA